MKPCIYTTISKNGDEITEFLPTARMILYSIHKAKNQGLADSEVCALAGLDAQNPMRWRVKYGTYFTDWLEEAIDHQSMDDAAVLERVGMIQAAQPGNYQYWRDMSRSKGVLKDEIKEVKITLNTDFSALLGGDLAEARKRILLKARGMVVPGRPGVATGAGEREHPGPGNRASDVQERSLEMANALGKDRGRSERSEPLPAVPKQDSFAMLVELLDEGEIPSSSEE